MGLLSSTNKLVLSANNRLLTLVLKQAPGTGQQVLVAMSPSARRVFPNYLTSNPTPAPAELKPSQLSDPTAVDIKDDKKNGKHDHVKEGVSRGKRVGLLDEEEEDDHDDLVISCDQSHRSHSQMHMSLNNPNNPIITSVSRSFMPLSLSSINSIPNHSGISYSDLAADQKELDNLLNGGEGSEYNGVENGSMSLRSHDSFSADDADMAHAYLSLHEDHPPVVDNNPPSVAKPQLGLGLHGNHGKLAQISALLLSSDDEEDQDQHDILNISATQPAVSVVSKTPYHGHNPVALRSLSPIAFPVSPASSSSPEQSDPESEDERDNRCVIGENQGANQNQHLSPSMMESENKKNVRSLFSPDVERVSQRVYLSILYI